MPGIMAKVRDPLLRQTVANVERSLNPRTRASYDSTVAAGMTLIWSEKFDSERETLLNTIQGPQDIPTKVAKGIVKVISMIQNEVSSKQPIPAAVPAAIVLMAQVLEYIEKKSRQDVTPEMVAQTTHLITQGIFSLFGITNETVEALKKRNGAQPGTKQAEAAPEAATAPQAPPPEEEAPPTAPPTGV
ncbi:MAG: hypothetical protein HQL97_00365 [Magnetococcales bacterium]|nr:hypothetical protein [Magnetococcales bacterium]